MLNPSRASLLALSCFPSLENDLNQLLRGLNSDETTVRTNRIVGHFRMKVTNADTRIRHCLLVNSQILLRKHLTYSLFHCFLVLVHTGTTAKRQAGALMQIRPMWRYHWISQHCSFLVFFDWNGNLHLILFFPPTQ